VGEKIPPFDPKNMNLSINPGDDFNLYVNGLWIENHPVPSDKSSYSDAAILEDQADLRIRAIIEDAANNTSAAEGSIEQKIGLFYRLGMDISRMEEQGLQPLREELDLIDSIASTEDVQKTAAHFTGLGISAPFFYPFGNPDFQNSNMMMAMLYQGGLGLPDKDYYFREDNESVKTREDYLKHVEKMFLLLGDAPENASDNARTVMRMETRLANSSFSNEENMQMEKLYNPMTVAELQSFAPGLNWTLFMEGIGHPEIQSLNICNPPFFRELGAMIEEEEIEDWKTFLRWKLISDSSPYLGAEFENESFDFYGRKLSGQEEMEPRWKRVVKVVDDNLGEATGQIFVKLYFDPQSKARMVEMTENLKEAFGSRIQNLTWMKDSTKSKALTKLQRMEIQVGYPEKWMDYSGLQIQNDSYVQNVWRATSFDLHHGHDGLDKAGKAVDRQVWSMTPQTINAYCDFSRNLMVFPAAILQPPYFNPEADDAVNYGAIGSTIGHEMIHGFDDQGKKFDAWGNMTNWWTAEDEEAFNQSTAILVEQYNSYEVLPGLFVNGNFTLGENIADLGGLTIAYYAWRLAQPDDGEEIDGFSPDQRFFLSYAQSWRESIREEALRTKVQTNPHSPVSFRVNGPVFDMPEFYAAFPEIGPDGLLYRTTDQRPNIW